MTALPDLSATICALATPPGEGAIGVIRVSGPEALAVVQPLTPKLQLAELPSHTLHLVKLREADGSLIDEAVLSVFRAPHSYTREDVIELSCHGSPYVLRRLLELLINHGARAAQPGEFTLRAYLNGALDLSQAEAVADLVAARSLRSQRLALSQLRGGYATRLTELRQQLLHFTALVELELDFGEEDVEFAQRNELRQLVANMQHELARLIASFAAGNALKHGIPTVIAGRPNAGKSTLLNRLLGDARAIVSPLAGTTRDVIEDRLLLGGAEFRLMDTAGLRDSTADSIEAEGIARSRARLSEALVVLYVFDAQQQSEADAEQDVAQLPLAPDAHVLLIANKADQVPGTSYRKAHPISALTGAGVETLEARLAAIPDQLGDTDTLVTNARHVEALRASAGALEGVTAALDARRSTELLAEDLRHALSELGRITGEVTPDEVLGVIFSKFCIGK